MRTIDRRDFLRLRAKHGARALEVSCRRLYLRLIDCQLAACAGGEFDGEPPAVFDRPTPDDVWNGLAHEMNEAGALRVLDREWLAGSDMGRRFDDLLSRFRARGGRVEFASTPEPRREVAGTIDRLVRSSRSDV